jgi:chaperonin GroES
MTTEAPAAPPVTTGTNGLPDIPEFQTQLELFEDKLLVQRVKKEAKSAGGILLPGQAQPDKLEAFVVAAGPGKLREDGTRVPMFIEPGDTVLLAKYAGTEYKENGQDRFIVSQSDLLGRFKS